MDITQKEIDLIDNAQDALIKLTESYGGEAYRNPVAAGFIFDFAEGGMARATFFVPDGVAYESTDVDSEFLESFFEGAKPHIETVFEIFSEAVQKAQQEQNPDVLNIS